MKLVTNLVLLVVSSCSVFAALDRMPQAIKQTDIDLPETMSGPARIDVLLNIGADGRVVSAEIHSSSKPEFDAACLKAVSEWKFKPAIVDGKPVSSKAIQPIVIDAGKDQGNRVKWVGAE